MTIRLSAAFIYEFGLSNLKRKYASLIFTFDGSLDKSKLHNITIAYTSL